MALMLAWLVSGTLHVLYVYVQVRCLYIKHFVAGFTLGIHVLCADDLSTFCSSGGSHPNRQYC